MADVLIRGMGMPNSCSDCPFDYDSIVCMATDKAFPDRSTDDGFYAYCSSRMPDCPLIEIPPHGRLGDLDKLEQMFVDIDNAPYSGFDGEDPFYSAEDAALIIRLTPTVIPADKDGET